MPRLLVVDDERPICQLLRDVFDLEGYTVDTAHNGREALQRAEAWRPHAIILDLRMPVMDGQAFLAERLRRPWLAAIPVVVLTAADGPAAQATVVHLHAAAALRKPFDAARLVEIVEGVVAPA